MVLIVLLICFSFRFWFGFFVFRHRRLSARYCVGLVGKANKGLRNSWFLRAWRHQSPCSCAGVSAILKRESYSPMLLPWPILATETNQCLSEPLWYCVYGWTSNWSSRANAPLKRGPA